MCVMKGYKYCAAKCQTLDVTCDAMADVSEHLDDCKSDKSKAKSCNKLYIITSKDFDTDTNVEAKLEPGEWCQIMLNDDILGDRLRYTIAFWVVNDNNTAGL